MGEFYAWAATGIVGGLQVWAEQNDEGSRQTLGGSRQYGGYAPAVISRQRFLLRQPDGRDVEILLLDSGLAFRNGHAITAVWAAREDAPYGHCIYLENHTTGGIARLRDNIELIRRKARWWKVTMFGFLATLPATIALIGWLFLQRGSAQAYEKTFFISAAVAVISLFIIGVVTSKLIFDYLRTEDERKIWLAADKALFHARRLLIERPSPRRYS